MTFFYVLFFGAYTKYTHIAPEYCIIGDTIYLVPSK